MADMGGDSQTELNAAGFKAGGLNAVQVADWVAQRVFSAAEIDCATAVMLKVLDGKCKMPPHETVVMKQLYLSLRKRSSAHAPRVQTASCVQTAPCVQTAERLKTEIPDVKLGDDIHQRITIALARIARQGALDDAMREHIYETRVLAETAISRPVMKRFKARLREEGLLPHKRKETDHAST